MANIKVKEKTIEADSGKNITIDEEFKKALIKASSDSDSEAQDSTKFTLLENLHNKLTSIFYTEFTKYDQVEQANRLKMWARLMPTVFGDTEGVKQCQENVYEHLYDHYQHMASHKRKRESALVYAVKQDTGLIQTDRQVASFLGGNRR